MTHGINLVSGEVCDKAHWVTIHVDGVPLRAMAGCVCGLAVFEGLDEHSVIVNERHAKAEFRAVSRG